MTPRHDLVVVGAGILGLATAREILQRRPGLDLVVLEQEPVIAQHQTGHNSGVVHTGIYYTPGSLKARLCRTGSGMLLDFCAEHRIPVERCGKLLIATTAAELPGLEELFRRGTLNGVPDLKLLPAEGIREIEPHAAGLRAIHSPHTAIVDFSTVAQALAAEVRRLGGTVLTSAAVRSIRRSAGDWLLRADSEERRTAALISCAGLQADRLATMTGASEDPRIIPFRGDYLALKPQRRGLVSGLIYPVPDPSLPFLGVHTTRRIDGQVWLGPNAVFAFSRHGYKFTTLSLRDLADSLRWPGFWRMARRHWRTSLAEIYRDLNRRAFAAALRRYLPELELADVESGPAGVRAQAVNRNGALVDDFVFSGGDGVLHVRNAPSPAATSCLAIAAEIADRFSADAIR
jgi:(S)-2-hydroxyglutarate dehydrogenase